jgi:hypothetical protein
VSSGPPRAVVVTRPTDYEALLARHGTREQARFFLETHRQDIADIERRHALFQDAMQTVSRAIPVRWRRSHLQRTDLDRFVFEPEDILVCVGQDGLVANTAKYLDGQKVVGINPDPDRYDGILVRHRASDAERVITSGQIEERTMVEAKTDDGQRLVAVNEIFIGHHTHQSARYRVRFGTKEERHSSSGIVVATGTGATGWARSISLGRGIDPSALPKPTDPRLSFFVREPFPSIATGTSVREGTLDARSALTVVSEMNEGGTLFGDGIEDDAIDFRWGLAVELRVARERLRLVR